MNDDILDRLQDLVIHAALEAATKDQFNKELDEFLEPMTDAEKVYLRIRLKGGTIL